jgi:hypothetical protein
MITPIKDMPLNSRVWIYQASRELNNDECEQIINRSKEFINTWYSHDLELRASVDIRYNRFIIIYVDESVASVGGCSLDKSTRFVKSVEQEFQVSLFDRMNFAYKENGVVKSAIKAEFEHLVSEGIVTEDTIVFNNLASTKDELEHQWEIPFKNSWHQRLFPIPHKV